MGMMETAEQEYQEVMNKKRIVANDKKKIEVRKRSEGVLAGMGTKSGIRGGGKAGGVSGG
jgi:hypothetical protein